MVVMAKTKEKLADKLKNSTFACLQVLLLINSKYFEEN